jgi:phage terminase large subunit GpA-like protein
VRPSRAGYKGADRVYLIGVDTAKDAIYARLRIESPGPGCIHFPTTEGVDQGYFDQLTAEHVLTKKRDGRAYRLWVLPPHKHNEALDCFALAMAAFRATGARLDVDQQPAPPPIQSPDIDPGPRQPWIDRKRYYGGATWWDRR